MALVTQAQPVPGFGFDTAGEELEGSIRVSRALMEAARAMTVEDARFAVASYYNVQQERIRASGQVRASKAGEGNPVLFIETEFERFERNLRRTLQAWADGSVVGRWAMSQYGIGPVLAAGLSAHIDISRAPTVGHIWRFAGLDPTVKWLPKTKRPWNADLKVLCWKIGESFVKVSNRDGDVYGHIYAERKLQEVERNLRGDFADQARASLEEKTYRPNTDAFTWYSGALTAQDAALILAMPSDERQGAVKRLAGDPGSGVSMLPPARIQLRSQRYAVKLFLSHWHHVAYESTNGEPPPFPYILTRPEHTHYLAPPNWPIQE
jgi:hypothetical protein